MRTFDLFNNRNFGKEWEGFTMPEIGFDISHLTNIKHGAISAAFMSISAYVLRFINYDQVVLLPLLTIPFLALGIIMSIREQGKKSNGHKLDYFDGMLSGMATTVTSISLFAIYITWYFTVHPKENEFFSPLMSACAVWIAGTALGIVVTFIAMQYYKGFNFNNNSK